MISIIGHKREMEISENLLCNIRSAGHDADSLVWWCKKGGQAGDHHILMDSETPPDEYSVLGFDLEVTVLSGGERSKFRMSDELRYKCIPGSKMYKIE
jgi:hypothetical protein